MGNWDVHGERACELGLLLAERVAPFDAGEAEMAHSFLLHDVGKLRVPAQILDKAAPLDEDEFAIIRRHPADGAEMLAGLGFSDRVVAVVRHHHERWDGRGYPDGIEGGRIPLWARMLAVADSVDAMTSERPYQDPRPLEEALTVLRAESGRQFDPVCVEGFLAIDRERLAAVLAGGYAAARSVASKSVRGIGPTHGELVPASR